MKKATVILERSRINDFQWESLQKVIARAKRAHYTNVLIRINGTDEVYEADWLKHFTQMERDEPEPEKQVDRTAQDLNRGKAV